MPQIDDILLALKKLKPVYEEEGLTIIGLFGSFAKNTQSRFSDIDIAYTIDYDKFSTRYKDGFSKLIRIDDIKKELQSTLKTKVDFVPDSNKAVLEGIVYV